MAHRIFLVSCGIFHCGAQLSNCDVWVQSLPWGMWDLPGSGIKLASSALQGRFFFFLPSREKHFLFDKLFSEVQHVVRFSLPSWGCVRLRVPYQTGGRQPCPPTSSRTMHRAFGRRRFGLAPISGLLLRQKSEFLSTEWKNGIHKHADTHGGKWTGFIKEEESMKLPAQTRRGGRVPCKADS